MSSHEYYEEKVSLLAMGAAAPLVWIFYHLVVMAVLRLVSLHSEKAIELMITLLFYIGMVVTVTT